MPASPSKTNIEYLAVEDEGACEQWIIYNLELIV